MHPAEQFRVVGGIRFAGGKRACGVTEPSGDAIVDGVDARRGGDRLLVIAESQRQHRAHG